MHSTKLFCSSSFLEKLANEVKWIFVCLFLEVDSCASKILNFVNIKIMSEALSEQ